MSRYLYLFPADAFIKSLINSDITEISVNFLPLTTYWFSLVENKYFSNETSTSFPRSSLYLEKVAWLRLVTWLCTPTQAAPRVSPRLNFVITVWGGDCFATTRTLFWKFWKGSKPFVQDSAWPVLHLNPLNFYEYEMLIERELCLYFTVFLNNRQQPASD